MTCCPARPLLITLALLAGTAALLHATPRAAHAKPSIRALDESFLTFARSTSKKPLTYRAITREFLTAAGRDSAAHERTMAGLADEFLRFFQEEGSPASPATRAALLQRFLFVQRGIDADLDLSSLENLYPDAILERKRGFCLGLSLLLVDLGERLQWPLQIFWAPRHIFVRYGEHADLNIETTQGGKIRSEAWYRQRYGLLRRLEPRQTAAHLINNHGYALLKQNQLDVARKQFKQALQVDRDLVEARINLGVIAARERDYDTALGEFDTALKAWPEDDVVSINRSSALMELKRWREAHKQMLAILKRRNRLEGLERAYARLTDHYRQSIEEPAAWTALQQLTTARNAILARTQGKKPGLRGSYFKGTKLAESSLLLTRIDPEISFRWSWGSPDRRVPRDHFSARWQGWLEAPDDDNYTFYVQVSDGVRIWIDGRQVMNSWRRANDNFPKGNIELTAGLHDLRIEYFETVGESGISILLTADKKERPLDVKKHLFHPEIK